MSDKKNRTACDHKKVGKVLREFRAGTLKSSSGEKITNRKQALAVALSEAGLGRKK